MEDPTIPVTGAPLQATTMHRSSWLHNPSLKTLLTVSIALTVFVFLILVAVNFSLVKFVITTHGERFEAVQNGVPTWYKSSFGMIDRVSGPKGFEHAPVTVLEAVPYGATSGEFVVLAKVAGVEGITIGILYANNSFENVLADGTNKADLAVRPDGMTLYAAMVDGESHIMQLDLTKSGVAPSDLGRGRSPRVFTDGFFVAISDRGIVRVDPVATSTSVLIPSTDADIYNGTISQDGVVAVISNTSGKTLMYRIAQTSPGDVALMSTSKFTALSPLSFVGTEFIIEPSAHNLSVYGRMPAFKNVGRIRVK